MGAVDLVTAFNAVASPAYTCAKATLGYERAHDLEWQVLTFSGTRADGSAFTAVEKLRGSADPVAGARTAAVNLLAKKEQSHELVPVLAAPADAAVAADPFEQPGKSPAG